MAWAGCNAKGEWGFELGLLVFIPIIMWMTSPLLTILIFSSLGFLAYMFIYEPDWVHKDISELFSTPDVKDPKNPTEEEIKKIRSEYKVDE